MTGLQSDTDESELPYEISLINLSRRRDRLVRATKWFGSVDLRFNRFEAIDGLSLPKQPREAKRREEERLTNPEIACGLSHKGVLRNFLDGEAEVVFVFEDDFIVSRASQKIVHWRVFLGNIAISMKRNSLDIVQLGSLVENRFPLSIEALLGHVRHFRTVATGAKSHLGQGFRVKFGDLYSGAHAYAVTRRGAQLILAKPDSLIPVDDWIVALSKLYPNRTARLLPTLFTQANRSKSGSEDSDIVQKGKLE